jgi:hypothetical protein
MMKSEYGVVANKLGGKTELKKFECDDCLGDRVERARLMNDHVHERNLTTSVYYNHPPPPPIHDPPTRRYAAIMKHDSQISAISCHSHSLTYPFFELHTIEVPFSCHQRWLAFQCASGFNRRAFEN